MRNLLLIALAAVMFVVAGCGATAPARLDTLPKAAQLKKAHERPLRYKVAFAPIVQDKEGKPKAQFAAAVRTDTAAMRNELARAMREEYITDPQGRRGRAGDRANGPHRAGPETRGLPAGAVQARTGRAPDPPPLTGAGRFRRGIAGDYIRGTPF